MNNQVPEDVYISDLASFPGPWAFQLPRSRIILVNDNELIEIANDPDKVLNLALGFDPYYRSLRQICEESESIGARTLIIAFDHFFQQYRPGIDSPRTLTPDMDRYVELMAKISRFVSSYGLRLELSILSPLEIGQAYSIATGESGRWMHYRKGLLDPKSGAYSVQLWQHQRWVNNKGPIDLEPDGIRVFAFKEIALPNSPYRVVDPDSMLEISETVNIEVFEGLKAGYVARRLRVYGKTTNMDNLDRILVIQYYKCPEMDYFSGSALPYLKGLIDKYINAGIQLSGFYSDEMHIQQDWNYFNHHEHGQFALRYVTPGLEKEFARRYGEQYSDLAKYMVYFVYGQEDFSSNVNACEGVMHVFGSTLEDIHRTALFRSRYYELLQNTIVDLFLSAKRYAEQRVGYRLDTRAHATWAESPTIDYWRTGQANMNSRKYEYTSNFIWSNTIHQSASACHDYFKWGEFLTGTGNDHPEGGWLDRNYYALALACSTGIINEVPHSYCAHWGHPSEVSWRRHQLQNAFGVTGSVNIFTMLQEMQHRDVDVLMLYPIDLVSVEERFGSWMTQYGYANMITQSKLLEIGKVINGKIEIAGRYFTTLVTTFEPFPSRRLLDMMREFAMTGGKVIWSSTPPLLDKDGNSILNEWQELFGVDYIPNPYEWGKSVPGQQIIFENYLNGVPPQIVLTDFLVDHIYPVTPRNSSEVIARCGKHVVGVYKRTSNGGVLVFLGYRPRDDQSASLGYETRNWFDVLYRFGAYPPVSSDFDNDNTEVISRTSDYLACRFPNGTITIAPHLKLLEENWYSGFSRNREQDDEIIKRLDLPKKEMKLKSFRVNGHCIDYEGIGAVAFRVDKNGNLIGFAGQNCNSIIIDGKEFKFSQHPVGQVGWSPVSDARRVKNGASLVALCDTPTSLKIPAIAYPDELVFYAEGRKPGQKGEKIDCIRNLDSLIIEVTEKSASRWLFGVPIK